MCDRLIVEWPVDFFINTSDRSRTWDARRSTTASLEAVAKLVKERPESFEEKTAKRASQAAAPLAAWVLANLQYGQILQQVAPLEKEQRLLAEYVGNVPVHLPFSS